LNSHTPIKHKSSPIFVPFESSYATSSQWIYINFYPILHHFQFIADYWSNFCFWQRVPLCNTLVRG